jgi:hypothetical protein
MVLHDLILGVALRALISFPSHLVSCGMVSLSSALTVIFATHQPSFTDLSNHDTTPFRHRHRSSSRYNLDMIP